MPTESPNTLRSRARYKIIDLLGIGQIGGLYNGARSVYFDETPVMNEDGTLNFPNFDVTRDLQQLLGESSQRYLPGFASIESETSVGVKVTKDSPEGSGSGDGSVTRTITDSDTDAARVTLRIPALTTTNTTTGDITGGTIKFKIQVKESGGSFVPIPAGQSWAENATATGDTPDGTYGLELFIQLAAGANGTLVFQYRKWNGSGYDSWVDYESLDIPKQNTKFVSPSREVSKSVTGLESGIYQARALLDSVLQTSNTLMYLSSGVIEISGKTTSPYDASYRVELPSGGAPWDIKVSRISNDNTDANIQDDLYWYSYTEIVDNKFYMPNCAAIGIKLNAEDFGGQLPSRAYEILGRNTIKIPDNYDPLTRIYTGVWTGTFTTGWTNNPAWIFYDLLTNKLYGLGDSIDESQIDIYALYEIAQYCDELVDTVDGEQEPRYTINCVINSQQEAYDLLNAIASAFRGLIYWGNGTISAVADMPTDAVIDVGPANVIDGLFTYQGASKKARHTVARVSWNNPNDGYKLNVELYEDEEAIRKYGYRVIDVNAYGCTSRGLARRWGKWLISSDLDTTDTVTYKASFDHFMKNGKAVRPGDVINVYDPNYSGVELFGRITDITDTGSSFILTLDREVTFTGGVSGVIRVPLADGSIVEADCGLAITSTQDTVTIAYASMPTPPEVGAIWGISFSTVEARQFKVFAVTEPEPHIYQVTAAQYDANKYDKVESDLNFEPADYTAFPSGELPAPTGVSYSEFLKQSGSSIISCVTLSWTRPDDPRAELFEVQYQIDGEPWQATTPNLVSETNVDIFDTQIDTYNFRVRAQDTTGIFRSAWTTYTGASLLGKTKEPEDVTGFSASIEKFGIFLEWNPVSDIDIDFYEIRSGASWAAGSVIAQVNAANYKHEDLTTGTYTFWIKAKDTSGNYSVNEATTSATVSAQAQPTVTATAVNGGIQLTIGGSVSRGFKSYEVQRKEYPSGSETTINSEVVTRIFTDTDIATLGYSTTWQYRVRALDQNGSASAWSNFTTPPRSAKKIENDDITANQIIAKDFRTACNAGCSSGVIVAGVLFNSTGIEAWSATQRTFQLDAATGDVSMTGTITATAGSIGGWGIYQTGIYKYTSDGRCGIHLDSNTPGMCIFDKNGGGHTTIGYISGGRFGFQLCDWNTGYNFFEASNCCTHIAGWNFNSACLYSGSLIINSSGSIQGNYTAGSAGWCIDCAGNAAFHSGCIGGWSITSNRLRSADCCIYLGKTSVYGDGLSIYKSCITAIQIAANCLYDATLFGGCIDRTGIVVRASNGSTLFHISSCATAATGDCAYIAGWSFNCNCLYSNKIIINSSGAIQGNYTAGSAGWCIDCAGNAAFHSGCIGGWSIANCCLVSSGCCGDIRLLTNILSSGIPSIIVRGCTTSSSVYSTFGGYHIVGGGGVHDKWGINVRAAATDIFTALGNPDGSIYCAQIAGWNFNSTQLYSSGCCLILCSEGSLQSGDFVASNKGWKICCNGNAEFNNICARGAIRTAVFIKDEISVVGGCTMIRPASVLSCDDSYSASSNIYYVDDNTQFAVNDLIRIKSNVGDFWGKVTASATGCITVGYCNGNTSGNITKGQAIVNYGSCICCGGIMLNGQCPYIDLYTHNGCPWCGTCSRVRIGNLDGWHSFSGATYGIAVGNPSGNMMTYDTSSGVLNILGNICVGSTLPINIPVGAIAEWSAKGSTTASIAVAGGVIDVSGNSNHGTAYNCVAITNDSEMGSVFSFDGSNDYINLGNSSDFSQANFTASAWIYPTGSQLGNVLSKGGNNEWRFRTNADLRMLFYAQGNSVISPDPVSLNTWTHVVVIGSSSGLRMYINGVLVVSNTTPYNQNITTCPLLMGNFQIGSSEYFPGKIAQPKIYDRALTAEEVYSLYTVGKQQESGNITAERVKTGVLSSLNWGTSAGSCISMNDGTFMFGGSSAPKLSWNGTTLTACGTICSCCGHIGGWSIGCTGLYYCTGAERIGFGGYNNNLTVFGPHFYAGDGGTNLITIGRCLWNGSWVAKRGIVIRNCNANVFQVHTDYDGTNLCAQIAGWNFNCNCLYSNKIIINSAGAIQGNYTAGSAGWCIDCAGCAEFNNVIVRGTVCSCYGCISGWTLASNYMCSTTANGFIYLYSGIGAILAFACGASCSFSSHGRMFWNGAYTNSYGFSVTNGTTGSLAAGMGYANAGTVTLPDSSTVACGCPFFWVGSSSSYAKYYGGAFTVNGRIYSCAGQISNFTITECLLQSCAILVGGCQAVILHSALTTVPGIEIYYCNSSSYTTTMCLRATNGSSAGEAPIVIGVPGTSCYGLYTLGRINVNSVVCTSDRNLKTDFQNVSVLQYLRQMPITKWRFCDGQDYHIGPMAQDFNCIFQLAHDWRTNKTVGGLDGIALKGVQELDDCVQYNNRRINNLESENAAIKAKIAAMECQLAELKEMVN